MPKTDTSFNPAEYAPVADRITHFYERFPNGRIVTKLVSRVDRGHGVFELTVRALVYRTADDTHVASSGYAAEREDDGDINAVACIENTETSAIGRALANLGFTAALRRPSYEEMQKADRARARLATPRTASGSTSTVPERPPGPDAVLQERADHALAVLDLLAEAERAGLPSEKSEPLRERLTARGAGAAQLERTEQLLRRWLAQQGTDGGGTGASRQRGDP